MSICFVGTLGASICSTSSSTRLALKQEYGLQRLTQVSRVAFRSTDVISVRCAAGPPQPPHVKSSFYKNPSRAIEKGGGFFIPGLRGPRLRYFVGCIVLALLVANMPQGTDVTRFFISDLLVSYRLSTAIGGAGGVALLVTAWQDSRPTERRRTIVGAAHKPAGNKAEQSISATSNAGGRLGARGEAELSWVANVVRDMVGGGESGGGLWVFRKQVPSGELKFLFSDREGGQTTVEHGDAGAVVDRVSQECRSLYVDDSTALPDGIGFPFLPVSGRWSVLATPLADGDGVLVVARTKTGKSSPTMSVVDRGWLEAFGGRVEEALRGIQ
jgi:hypothetical protein